MGKPADIEPRWLVSLMCVWARRADDLEARALGYPGQSSFLRIGSATSAQTDPTAFSAREFNELNVALKECQESHMQLWAALMMYYRPWCIEAFKAEGWPFSPNRVYWDNLVRAHQWVSTRILSMSATEKAYATS